MSGQQITDPAITPAAVFAGGTVDTLIVGGGQAGLAMSAHLSRCGVPHLILERDRIAERWRSRRWDSLVANGPAWHDRFPDLEFVDDDPESFPGKERIADYFEEFARSIRAPALCGVDVTCVTRREGHPGFHVATSRGELTAQRVVAATGPFQVPVIPFRMPESAGIFQLHSANYRSHRQLPEGSVLVVGAGSSGAQIAEDLRNAGRDVGLAVGPHHRPPRRYRGRDYCWWLGVLGKWDAAAPDPDTAHITIAVSGAGGGKTVDFRELAASGIKLFGMLAGFDGGCVQFTDDLAKNIAGGDADYLAMLDEADAYAAANGLDLPEEPEARRLLPAPDCAVNPTLSLNLRKAGISTVLWATGYAYDFSWLAVDAFDDRGQPRHYRGVSDIYGLYFLGLPWLSRRGSSFIWGVWHDARHIAEQITIQRSYLQYHEDRSMTSD